MSIASAPILGYGFATLAFCLLFAFQLGNLRQKPHTRWSLAAALATALWSLITAIDIWRGLPPTLTSLLLELLRNLSWLGLLDHILQSRRPPGTRVPRFLWIIRLLVLSVCSAILALRAGWTPFPDGQIIVLDYSGWILLAMLGLILAEQLLRITTDDTRWSLQLLGLSFGALFAFDFYLYSTMLLFGNQEQTLWIARGYVLAIIVPLLGVGLARLDAAHLRFSLSRQLVFHSASLLMSGLYLVLTASTGYYLQVYGGDWGDILQTVFIFGALLLLAIILMSGGFRARLKVFLSKHFFSYRYDYREEWLKFSHALSGSRDGNQLGQRILGALADLVDSDGGALWLCEPQTPVLRRHAHWGLQDAPATLTAASPCVDWLEKNEWVINLDEMRTRPQRYQGLTLPAELQQQSRIWLIVPLLLNENLIGCIGLKHSTSRVHLNWEVGDLLKTAARQAAAHLAQFQAAQQLILARQFESYNRATTFVVHDLKNLVAQQSLLLANATRHKHNPAFQEDVLATVQSSVTRMNKVLEQLRRSSDPALPACVDLVPLLPEIIASKQAFRIKPALNIACPHAWVQADAARLIRVLGHILQNALEATPEEGAVTLTLSCTDLHLELEIRDTGNGMSPDFVLNRLFAPFDSTKDAGMGIGAYECREYVRELGGDIHVISFPGEGSTFTIQLPAGRAAGTAHEAVT
jgi:putative PEP-CTERM system histidine kinase